MRPSKNCFLSLILLLHLIFCFKLVSSKEKEKVEVDEEENLVDWKLAHVYKPFIHEKDFARYIKDIVNCEIASPNADIPVIALSARRYAQMTAVAHRHDEHFTCPFVGCNSNTTSKAKRSSAGQFTIEKPSTWHFCVVGTCMGSECKCLNQFVGKNCEHFNGTCQLFSCYLYACCEEPHCYCHDAHITTTNLYFYDGLISTKKIEQDEEEEGEEEVEGPTNTTGLAKLLKKPTPKIVETTENDPLEEEGELLDEIGLPSYLNGDTESEKVPEKGMVISQIKPGVVPTKEHMPTPAHNGSADYPFSEFYDDLEEEGDEDTEDTSTTQGEGNKSDSSEPEEVAKPKTVGVSKPKTTEVPKLKLEEFPKPKTVDVSKPKTAEVPKPKTGDVAKPKRRKSHKSRKKSFNTFFGFL